MASVWNDNIQFFQTSLWTNLKFKKNPSGNTQEFDICRDVSDTSKIIPKVSSSIYLKTEKYRKGLWFLFKMGSKFARMYAVFGFGSLRFVRYHHYSISMLVYCTAMYKLCDCWKKSIMKSSFRRNQLCRINCIRFFARRPEQTKLESWIHCRVIIEKKKLH